MMPSAEPVGSSTHRWAVVCTHDGEVDVVSASVTKVEVARELRLVAAQLEAAGDHE